MRRCCAYKCSNKGIYRFPEDPCLQKLWATVIQPKHWTPESRFRLCGDHFKPDDFEHDIKSNKVIIPGSKPGKRVLKKTAIPSVFVQKKKNKLNKELEQSPTVDMNNFLLPYAEQNLATTKNNSTKTENREKIKEKTSRRTDYEELVNIEILEPQQKQKSQEVEQRTDQINTESELTEHTFSRDTGNDLSDSENELVIDEDALKLEIIENSNENSTDGVVVSHMFYRDIELNATNENGKDNAQLTNKNDSGFCVKRIESKAGEINISKPAKSTESPGVILFFDKCRLCLDKCGEKTISTTDLQDDIFNCTGVKVLPSDNLPQKICLQCLDIVNKCKALRELASKNNLHLRSLFDEKGNEESISQKTDAQAHNDSNYEQIVDSTVFVPDLLTPRCDKRNVRKRNLAASDSEDIKPIKNVRLSVRTDIYEEPKTIVIRTADNYHKYKDRIKAVDGTDNVIYECEICNKTFNVYKKLYLHKRYHVKNVKCTFEGCDKMFSNNADMSKHVLTHTGTKPYVCEKCDRGFTQKVTLRSHLENVCN